MRTVLVFVVFTVFLLIGFPGCVSECHNKPGAKEYEEIVGSIVTSNTIAIKKFSEFSVNEQITIFLYARNCPDDPRIRGFFILDGEKKIPTIVERIKTEPKLWDKAELVSILIPINTQCKCITRESEVIATLEDIGKELDADKTIPADYTYKQMYKRSVEALKYQLETK